MKHINNKKAFTLIELLIVIAIIGILFVVLVSRVDFATDKAKATGVQTDFRSFQNAFEAVSNEHAGFATFGWDTGDYSDRRLWYGKTTPDGQAYVYSNSGKDVGDRVRNSYDIGDANLNGIQDSGETFVGRKFYTETWTGNYSLINPATHLNSDDDGFMVSDSSAIHALERAINSHLDPKMHITIHDDYTITMANGYTDPWGTEYHGIYLSNAAADGMDRGAIVMYSNGANKEFGSAQSLTNGVVTIGIPGNNKLGQDDYALIVCYTYEAGFGTIEISSTGFLSGRDGNQAEIFPDRPMNGTTYVFENRIEYDSSTFEKFDFDAQTGWKELPYGSYITNGSISYQIYGLTMTDAFGYTFFGPVSAAAEPWALGYFPDNDIGVPSGWFIIDNTMVIDYYLGVDISLEEMLDSIVFTVTPTIIFGNGESEALDDPEILAWIQEYMIKK